MDDGYIELVGILEMDHRGFKECLIRPIFRPPIVPLVDVRPVQFIAACLELAPLDAGVEDMQDLVEDLEE